MGRMRLRKNIFIKLKYRILIVILIIIGFVIYMLNRFGDESLPYLLEYAESESVEITTMLINKAITEEVVNNSVDKITILEKNDNNEIINVTYDTDSVNKLLYNVSNNILESIANIEKGNVEHMNLSYYNKDDLIYYIPLGVIYNVPILTDISPKIPYKVSFLGSVDSFVDTQITEYGINNSLVELSINVDINLKVIFPFLSKNINVNKEIPLSTNVIQGKIPSYYGGVILESSSIKTN